MPHTHPELRRTHPHVLASMDPRPCTLPVPVCAQRILAPAIAGFGLLSISLAMISKGLQLKVCTAGTYALPPRSWPGGACCSRHARQAHMLCRLSHGQEGPACCSRHARRAHMLFLPQSWPGGAFCSRHARQAHILCRLSYGQEGPSAQGTHGGHIFFAASVFGGLGLLSISLAMISHGASC